MSPTSAPATERSLKRKKELLDVLSRTAVSDREGPVSLRQFAIRAGVSEPTLRHHFGDRRGVVIAILQHFADEAQPFLELSARPASTLQSSIAEYATMAQTGFENETYIKAHAFALVESIHDSEVAQAYLTIIIEPSLKAIEERLSDQMSSQGHTNEEIRSAALMIYAPTLFTALHQNLLKGDVQRPLNMTDFMNFLTRTLSQGLEKPI